MQAVWFETNLKKKSPEVEPTSLRGSLMQRLRRQHQGRSLSPSAPLPRGDLPQDFSSPPGLGWLPASTLHPNWHPLRMMGGGNVSDPSRPAVQVGVRVVFSWF